MVCCYFKIYYRRYPPVSLIFKASHIKAVHIPPVGLSKFDPSQSPRPPTWLISLVDPVCRWLSIGGLWVTDRCFGKLWTLCVSPNPFHSLCPPFLCFTIYDESNIYTLQYFMCLLPTKLHPFFMLSNFTVKDRYNNRVAVSICFPRLGTSSLLGSQWDPTFLIKCLVRHTMTVWEALFFVMETVGTVIKT